jgi:hypothetical protein
LARSSFEKTADVGVVVFKQETSNEDEENKNKEEPARLDLDLLGIPFPRKTTRRPRDLSIGQ